MPPRLVEQENIFLGGVYHQISTISMKRRGAVTLQYWFLQSPFPLLERAEAEARMDLHSRRQLERGRTPG